MADLAQVIKLLKEVQSDGKPHICPRCGEKKQRGKNTYPKPKSPEMAGERE